MKTNEYRTPRRVAILYHLYRVRYIAKNDLSLYAGKEDDRYTQQLLKRHIAAGNISTTTYDKCTFCQLTEQGEASIIQEEREAQKQAQERGYTHLPLSDTMLEYEEYCEKNNLLPQAEAYTSRIEPTEMARRVEMSGGNGANVDGPYKERGNLVALKDPNSPTPVQNFTANEIEAKNVGTRDMRITEWEPIPLLTVGSDRKQLDLKATESSNRYSTVRKASTVNMLLSAGVRVHTEDKPPLRTLLHVLSQANYDKSFVWQLVERHGIYYTRREFYDVCGYWFRSSVQGVLFTGSGWYVCHNVFGRLAKFSLSEHSAEAAAITKALTGTLPYSTHEPRAIIFGKGRSMAATIVSGHKYGRNRMLKPNGRERYQASLSTAENLSAIYESAILTELNSNGLYTLERIVSGANEDKNKHKRLKALVQNNPNAFALLERNVGTQIVVYERKSGNPVTIAEDYDLISLYKQRHGSENHFYIAPEKMSEQIAKSLGGKLATFLTIPSAGGGGGKFLTIPLYDRYGNKAIPDTTTEQ